MQDTGFGWHMDTSGFAARGNPDLVSWDTARDMIEDHGLSMADFVAEHGHLEQYQTDDVCTFLGYWIMTDAEQDLLAHYQRLHDGLSDMIESAAALLKRTSPTTTSGW